MNLVSAPTIVNIDIHIKLINDLVSAIPKAKAEIAQCKLLIGQSIKAIKEARPNNWIAIVKVKCNLGRRAAYYYLAFVEGKPVEQHRAENRKRVARHARHRALANAQKQAQIDKLNAQIDRLKAKIAELQSEKVLKAEIAELHVTLKKIGETLGVAIGLTGHFEHNRNEIVHKLNVAKNAADVALKAAPTSKGKAPALDDKLFAKAMTAPLSSGVH
jgi:protein required for attachment to host cells